MLLNQLNSISSPLSDKQVATLQQLTAEMSAVELSWVSGYLAALSHSGSVALAPQAAPAGKLTVLYGSQTGNAKGVAQQVAAEAEAKGMAVTLVSMADYKTKQLKDETHLLIVVSTNGEGEPPDDAEQLHSFLAGKRAPKLESLSYSVLGLGDSSYEFFCQTAIDFDERLAALGAKAIVPRQDCDVDYDGDVLTWQAVALEKVADTLDSGSSAQVINLPVGQSAASQYSKKNPLAASLLASQKITSRFSGRDVRHVEISLEESGLIYQPGDALGVWFDNDPQLVTELLGLLELSGETQVTVGDKTLSLTDALVQEYELTQLHPGFVTAYGEAANISELAALADDKAAMREYFADRQVIDVVRQYPAAITAEQLQGALRRLTPRLYSIASSLEEAEDEVHLTVAVVDYQAFDHDHQGAASSYLGQRLEEGGQVRVFVESNNNFRLPAADTPVIMIGPGTGIAPFRAFLQQRDNDDAGGDNWLFFGNQHFTDDFLYQVELQDFLNRGVLNRLDLAFSRDQAEKIYVQDRIREQGAELYQWLEKGAHLYICGDGNRMAKDVHQALLEVIQQQGNKDLQQAEDYLAALRSDKRYQKDVY